MKEKINDILHTMASELDARRGELLCLNQQDVANCSKADVALYDRLFVDDNKINGMIASLEQVAAKPSPVHETLYAFEHENGLKIENKTVPFGTILIVYESRPDVTIEATAIALKSGNKILLKGGKEARNSNLFLAQCWTKALEKVGLETSFVRYLDMNRIAFQEYVAKPDTTIDLIIPRGGERLIEYVYSVAQCPVLVSGRGNNFLYVAPSADLKMATSLIIQSKISKISACNALDKVLIDRQIPDSFVTELIQALQQHKVTIIQNPTDAIWREEFLDNKIVLAPVDTLSVAISMINRYAGKHSATIVTQEEAEASTFMDQVDCAAVYHNASTRFTDGYEFGLGAEMAISTQKLHQRGPLGIEHLVTNKWYIKGHGQIR